MNACAQPQPRSAPRRALAPLLVAAAVLAGCAAPQPKDVVTPLGGDYFSVVREAPTGLTSLATLQAEAHAAAKRFCADRKASVQVLTARESKGWSAAGNTPRFELQFSCVPHPPEPLPPVIGAPRPLAPAASVAVAPASPPPAAAPKAAAPAAAASVASAPVAKPKPKATPKPKAASAPR